MSNLSQALWVELLKARRSKMPLLTGLVALFTALVGGFFMVILKDPEFARRVGLISAKAQLTIGVADWPAYLGFMSLATAAGGSIIFSFIASWVFGREYADRTVKDLLALPTSRSAIVLAKFILIGFWCAAFTILLYLASMTVGAAVGLPPASPGVIRQGTLTLAIAACLTIILIPPIAFVASAGHGYLPPIGAAFLFMVLAQIIVIIGWGEYFPWSVPALYADQMAKNSLDLGAASYVIVFLTGLAGFTATFLWWELADQTQ